MRQGIGIAVVLGLLLTLPLPSIALFGVGDVVHDPIAYIVHVKNQVELHTQTLRQAQMIAQQAQMLQYQLNSMLYAAQNLNKNPLVLLNQIQALWQNYQNLLQNAEGLSYNLAQAGAQFDYLYPRAGGLGSGMAAIAAESNRMLTTIRQASRTAVQSQSVLDRMKQQQALNAQAVTSAQAADGALKIAQAQAQMQGLTNAQLASLEQMLAAQGRMQATYIMREVTAEERAQWQAQAWMADWPTTRRGPHEGRGPALPQ